MLLYISIITIFIMYKIIQYQNNELIRMNIEKLDFISSNSTDIELNKLQNIITIKDKYINELDIINLKINNLARSTIIEPANKLLFAEYEVDRLNIKKTYNLNIQNFTEINFLTELINKNNIIHKYLLEINDLKEIRKNQRNIIIELKQTIENLRNNNEDLSLLCSICLDIIPDSINYTNKRITRCNHLFHKNCLEKWGKNTCPNCRSIL